MKKFWYSFVFMLGFGVYVFILSGINAGTKTPTIIGSDISNSGNIATTTTANTPDTTSVGSETTNPGTNPSPAPKPTPKPTPTPTPTPVLKGQYVDGSYTGSRVYVFYGYIQVRAIISGGKLTSVAILDYPQDRSTSREINGQALPLLVHEAIAAQSGNVDTISGASDSSEGFRQSLTSALAQAKS